MNLRFLEKEDSSKHAFEIKDFKDLVHPNVFYIKYVFPLILFVAAINDYIVLKHTETLKVCFLCATVLVSFVFITELNILMNPYRYVYCEYNIPFYALIMFWNANLRRPKFNVLSCNFTPYMYYLIRNYRFYGLI